MASAPQLRQELPIRPIELPPDTIYFGPSEAMRQVRQRVDRAAVLNVPILVLGESGTGKEVLARYIHNRSPWRYGPFVKVNCPAIPGALFESELFGFQKGAFTGAIAAKPGRMELANGGTLFLDEIVDLDSSLQAKLLHVLQDGYFTRIGDHEEKQLGRAYRMCHKSSSATRNQKTGGFRADLLYRINVISVTRYRRYATAATISPAWPNISAVQFNTRFKKRGSAAVQGCDSSRWFIAIGLGTFASWKIVSRAT